MRTSPIFTAFVLVSLAGSIVGCSGADDAAGSSNDSSSGAGAGGAAESTGSVGSGGGSSTGGPPPTCSSAPSARPVVCSGAACTVAVDVEIQCTEGGFASAGVRVGGAAGSTFVATASPHDVSRLLSIDSASASAVSGFDMSAAPIAVAVSSDGRLLVVGDSQETAETARVPGGVRVDFGLPGALGHTALETTGGWFSPYLDVAWSADGAALVWFQDAELPHRPYGTFTTATIGVDGSVVTSAAPFPPSADGTTARFAVSVDGDVVGYGLDEDGAATSLLARVGSSATTKTFGLPPGATYIWDYRPLQLPVPASAETVQYAVVEQDDAAVHIVSPAGAPSVPGAATFIPVCSGDETPFSDPPCPPCHETGVGVVQGAFGAARLPNDGYAAAFLVAHHDDDVTYTVVNNGAADVCDPHVARDGTTYELVVVVGSLTGAFAEAEILRQPFTAIDVDGAFEYAYEPLLDVATAPNGEGGSDVLVAARVGGGADGAKVRVIRLSPTAPG